MFKKSKKILCFVLAFVLCISCLPLKYSTTSFSVLTGIISKSDIIRIYTLPAGYGFVGFFAGVPDALCTDGYGGDGFAVQRNGNVIVALAGVCFQLSQIGETSFRRQDPRPAGAVRGIHRRAGRQGLQSDGGDSNSQL